MVMISGDIADMEHKMKWKMKKTEMGWMNASIGKKNKPMGAIYF